MNYASSRNNAPRTLWPNRYSLSIILSYLGLRSSFGLLALSLPVVLGPIGYFLFGIPIQKNISSYYHTPLRDVFVGTMCSMGVFLYCYRGEDFGENVTSLLAAASAIGIGLCPIDPNSDPLFQSSFSGYVHTASGGIFFLTLAIFSLYHFPRGHFGLKLQTRDERRDSLYFASGLVLVVAMLLMGAYLVMPIAEWRRSLDAISFLFWMEWVAVSAFGVSWVVKGQALRADAIRETRLE